MSTGSLDHLYHQQVTPPNPAMDSTIIPNPRIVLFYRRATYADVLAASDASWRNVLHLIDWERYKIPVPSEADRQSTSIGGDASSGEETDSAEERESSDDGSLSIASPPSPIKMPPVIVQPVLRMIPNAHHAAQTSSIFRPSPTPLVFHPPKSTIYGHPAIVGELKSPPPAHQPPTRLHPVVLKPIQNLNPLQQLQQTTYNQSQQSQPLHNSSRHLLMVYTKPVINAKPQVIRLVNRNVAAVGTNAGV